MRRPKIVTCPMCEGMSQFKGQPDCRLCNVSGNVPIEDFDLWVARHGPVGEPCVSQGCTKRAEFQGGLCFNHQGGVADDDVGSTAPTNPCHFCGVDMMDATRKHTPGCANEQRNVGGPVYAGPGDVAAPGDPLVAPESALNDEEEMWEMDPDGIKRPKNIGGRKTVVDTRCGVQSPIYPGDAGPNYCDLPKDHLGPHDCPNPESRSYPRRSFTDEDVARQRPSQVSARCDRYMGTMYEGAHCTECGVRIDHHKFTCPTCGAKHLEKVATPSASVDDATHRLLSCAFAVVNQYMRKDEPELIALLREAYEAHPATVSQGDTA